MIVPLSSVNAVQLLSSYPHVARCADCRDYADDYLDRQAAPAVLVAVLDHHDSAHAHDRFSPRCATF